MKAIIAMLRDDRGAAMVEYAIILAFISLASLAALTLCATTANTTLDDQQTNLQTVQTSP